MLEQSRGAPGAHDQFMLWPSSPRAHTISCHSRCAVRSELATAWSASSLSSNGGIVNVVLPTSGGYRRHRHPGRAARQVVAEGQISIVAGQRGGWWLWMALQAASASR